jgi:hypothetical protein
MGLTSNAGQVRPVFETVTSSFAGVLYGPLFLKDYLACRDLGDSSTQIIMKPMPSDSSIVSDTQQSTLIEHEKGPVPKGMSIQESKPGFFVTKQLIDAKNLFLSEVNAVHDGRELRRDQHNLVSKVGPQAETLPNSAYLLVDQGDRSELRVNLQGVFRYSQFKRISSRDSVSDCQFAPQAHG